MPNVIMLTVIMLSAIILGVVLLIDASLSFMTCYHAGYRYSECPYAECHLY